MSNSENSSEKLQKGLENTPEIFELDPVFAAARVAAEMAKRVHWNYNQTTQVQEVWAPICDGVDIADTYRIPSLLN